MSKTLVDIIVNSNVCTCSSCNEKGDTLLLSRVEMKLQTFPSSYKCGYGKMYTSNMVLNSVI